jgi:hypothetical protein
MLVRYRISHNNLIKLWNFAERLVDKKKADKQVRNLDKYSQIVNTFEAFKGQFVVNEMTSYPFDWEVRYGNDNGYDGKINGIKYEVKSNITYPYPKADLMMWLHQPIKAPLIILTAKVPEYYGVFVDICGYITIKEFENNSIKTDKYWKINSTNLRSIRELFVRN